MSKESIYKRYIPALTPEPGAGDKHYWLAFSANRLLVSSNNEKCDIPHLKSLDELHLFPIRTQYLGALQGYSSFSAEVAPDAIAPPGMVFRDLRSLYGALDDDLFLLAGRAVQIVAWDQTHQFCGRCGHKTEDLPGERAKKCPACGFTSYPRLSPATITAVLKEDKILLSRYASFRGHMHTISAGFVEPGETLEECVRREIKEEVGIQVKNIKFFGSQPWPFPNSLMIGFTAEWESGEITPDGKEIAEAGWYDVHNLPEIPGKMSIAREIIDWYVQTHSDNH